MSTTNKSPIPTGDVKEDLQSTRVLNGLLAAYRHNEINECVKTALKRKLRVRYKCMDTHSNFLAFGTTVGAIYLFKLQSITHSSCKLALMIPCDQGSIEVIKFLPNPHADDLLVAIGTSRGSLVVFRLVQRCDEQNHIDNEEIYRAECFTNSSAIKIIEFDPLDPTSCFNKLYICDSANRLYVLESNSIYSTPKQALRLFYSNQLPALIFSVNGSNINQISVHRSQLLISTDETTRYFNETTNQLCTIGKKKRREGFFGACFFNPIYKPMRVIPEPHASQQSLYSSTGSINELVNMFIFVSRPMFRLWQVNGRREVMFTHQFESSIKSTPVNNAVLLQNNVSVDTVGELLEDARDIIDSFANSTGKEILLKNNHFQRLMPLYSSTLGNLLLSYTKNEIFIVDPINARLIVWHSQELPIVHVSCNGNEIFILSLKEDGDQRQQFQVDRLVLLAPAQLVLELHRLHRHLSLILFVQMFSEQFRQIMALPLSRSSIITTEGGLLRNVIMNAWNCIEDKLVVHNIEDQCQTFKRIIEDILFESKQLKQSLENLTDSRFFLTMTNENIERLCSEPYTSLISLEVSIANLHTNHVIHFSKHALNRHKSLANFSQSARNLTRMKATTQSNFDMTLKSPPNLMETNGTSNQSTNNIVESSDVVDSSVIVERQYPTLQKRRNEIQHSDDRETSLELTSTENRPSCGPFFSVRGRNDILNSRKEYLSSSSSPPPSRGDTDQDDDQDNGATRQGTQRATSKVDEFKERHEEVDSIRCTNCKWPRPRSHLLPMHSSQQIQYGWIQENLLLNFEENIVQIEERAFKHGLWHLLLKCFAFNNKIDEYITCCIILDDVRLLNVEQFVVTRQNETELIDRLLGHLEQKIDFIKSIESADPDQDGRENKQKNPREYCFKCRDELKRVILADDEIDEDGEDEGVRNSLEEDDEISFNLVNLFERIMSRQNADFKRCIAHLLKHPKVLNNSKIPATFYLKAIASTALNIGMGSNRNGGRSRQRGLANLSSPAYRERKQQLAYFG